MANVDGRSSLRLRSAWGLDIGSSSLKIARVDDAGGRLTAQTFGPVALPADATAAPETLVKAISSILATAGVKRTHLSVAIPRSVATIKFPVLPHVEPSQLAQLVRFEAQRYVPFPVENVILSFQSLPQHSHDEASAQGSTEMTELVLVAVRRDVIRDYRQAISAANGMISHLNVSTMGLWNALKHANLPVDDDEALVVVDIGGKWVTILAFHKGEMIFNRAAEVGCDALTVALMESGSDRASAEASKRNVGLEPYLHRMADGPLAQETSPAESWVYSLFSELRRSLAALRGERRNLRIEKIYLSGGGAKTPGLTEYLERSLSLPTQLLEISDLVPDPQFIEAAGIALGALNQEVSPLDLIRDEFIRERKKRSDAMKLRLGGLVGAVALSVAVYFGVQSMQAQQQAAQKIDLAQKEVRAGEQAVQVEQNRYDRLMSQAQILSEALRSRANWLDVLQDVSDRAPSGVWVTGIDLEKGKKMNIRGSALSQSAVLNFSANLAKSPLLINPTLSYSNQAKVGEKTVFQFGISSDIKGNLPKPNKPEKKRAAAKKSTTTSATGGATNSESSNDENSNGVSGS
jgi:type IV pilus assembly protein PilM